MSETVKTSVEAKLGWVLVREDRDRAEGKTKAGIIMPGGMSEDVKYGWVVSVGIGILLENGNVVPPQSEVGAYVAYQPEVGHIFLIGSVPHIAVTERDIIFEVKE